MRRIIREMPAVKSIQEATGGAKTTRVPFDSAALTTPAFSMSSIIVAARL